MKGRGRKVLLLTLSLLVCFSLFAATTCAPAEPEVEKTWELKHLTTLNSPDHITVKVGFLPFCEAVEQRTNGRVRISMFYGDSLAPIKEHYTAVAEGVADFSGVTLGYLKGVIVLAEAGGLPGLFASSEEGGRALNVLAESGLLDKEFEAVKLFGFYCSSPSQLLFAKKKVEHLSDIKGLRIRCPGGIATEVYKVWGAVPVSLPASEIYGAMEKAVIDGTQFSLASSETRKLYEVSKYIMKVRFNVSPNAYYMNLDTWNSFPPDIQKIIEEEAENCLMNIAIKAYDERDTIAEEFMKGYGLEIYDPADREEWMKPARSIHDVWLKQVEEKGLSGREVLELLQAAGK